MRIHGEALEINFLTLALTLYFIFKGICSDRTRSCIENIQNYTENKGFPSFFSVYLCDFSVYLCVTERLQNKKVWDEKTDNHRC